MNDSVDEPGVPNGRDQVNQLIEQAKAWSSRDYSSLVTGSAKAWMKSDHLSHLFEQARAWRQIDPMSQLTDQTRAWMKGDHLSHLAGQAQTWKQIDSLTQMTDQARAWLRGDRSNSLAEQVRILSKTDHLSQLAEQARAWLTGDHLELARHTIPNDITLRALLGELASRSPQIMDAPASASNLEQVSTEQIESVSIGDLYVGEVNPARNAKPTLSGAPTWLLYLWLLCIAPALAVLTHWEDVRQGLVDINERIPEEYSFSGLKRFIRTNLAGKPGDIRLVTGSDVRLRVAPGMKSDVLLTLPKHAAVVVLDKEDRTWLYVSYEHEGFLIDGYVSTKFLRKVRK
jgi:hypothetical protein